MELARALFVLFAWSAVIVSATAAEVPIGTAQSVEAVRTLALAIRLDARYALVAGAEERARQSIAAASAALAPVGLGLAIRSIRVAAVPEPRASALRLLDAVEQSTDPEADVTVLFTALPAPAPTRDEHVAGRYTGSALVVRSMTLFFEPEDTAGLADAETRLLLQGIGTIFGAVAFCDDPLMAGRFPPTDALPPFQSRNVALIRAHRSLDLRRSARPRLSAAIAREALNLLTRAQPAERRCAARELAEREKTLLAVLTPTPSPPALPAAPANESPEAAWTRCQSAAQTAPDSEAARCAGLAAVAIGRTDEAIRYLRAWRAGHPDDLEAMLGLARTLGRLGDDGAARALLEEFATAHPEAVLAWLNLGVAEARLGRLPRARAAWQHVLRLDPDHADARLLLSKLPPD